MLNKKFVALSRKFMIPVVAVILSLLGTHIFFRTIQHDQGQANLKRITAILQNDQIGSNPYLVLQDVNELKALKLVDCIQLSQISPVQRSFVSEVSQNCDASTLSLVKTPVHAEIFAANGSRWNVQFNSVTPRELLELFWVTKLFVVLLVTSLFFAFKQRERRILETEKLKYQHQEELSQLARKVAHDIRSPLSDLRLCMASTDNWQERQHIGLNALDRINQIANDLLDQSRPKQMLVLSEASEAINQIFTEVKLNLLNKDLSLVQRGVNPQLTHQLSIARADFERILSNLINNAIEAGAKSIAVSVSADSEFLKIQIDDDGSGFPANFRISEI